MDRRPPKRDNKLIHQDKKNNKKFVKCPNCDGKGTIGGQTCIACQGRRHRYS